MNDVIVVVVVNVVVVVVVNVVVNVVVAVVDNIMQHISTVFKQSHSRMTGKSTRKVVLSGTNT